MFCWMNRVTLGSKTNEPINTFTPATHSRLLRTVKAMKMKKIKTKANLFKMELVLIQHQNHRLSLELLVM
jgi:hypothetical protein